MPNASDLLLLLFPEDLLASEYVGSRQFVQVLLFIARQLAVELVTIPIVFVKERLEKTATEIFRFTKIAVGIRLARWLRLERLRWLQRQERRSSDAIQA